MTTNRRVPHFLALFLVTGVIAVPVRAQYDQPRDYAPLEARFGAAGVIHSEFTPRGGNSAADSLVIRYAAWMPVVSFHQGPVEIMFGYTRYTLRGSSRTAIHFGTVVTNDFPLSASRSHALAVPVCVAADFTKAESTGAERDNFNIASLGLGAGLLYRLSGTGADLRLRALGIVHYSFEGLSTGSGSSSVIQADASLLLRFVHVGEGIALGYRFRLQNWSLSSEQFNYRAVTHGPYIGILF